MDEQVIDDLYNRAKGEGYSKSRNEFITLLHSDSEVFNDMYSYVKSQGYQKDINAFSALVGKSGTPAPAQQPVQQPVVEKKNESDTTALPAEDTSSALPLPPTKTKEDEEDVALAPLLNYPGNKAIWEGMGVVTGLGLEPINWLLKKSDDIINASKESLKSVNFFDDNINDSETSVSDAISKDLKNRIVKAQTIGASPFNPLYALESIGNVANKIINSTLSQEQKNVVIKNLTEASGSLRKGIKNVEHVQSKILPDNLPTNVAKGIVGFLPELGMAALMKSPAALESRLASWTAKTTAKALPALAKVSPKVAAVVEKNAPKIGKFVEEAAVAPMTKIFAVEGAISGIANKKEGEGVVESAARGARQGFFEGMYMHGLGVGAGKTSPVIARGLSKTGMNSAISTAIANPLANAGVFATAKAIRTPIEEGRAATAEELEMELGMGVGFSTLHAYSLYKNHNELNNLYDNTLKNDELYSFGRAINETKANLELSYNPDLTPEQIAEIQEARDELKKAAILEPDLQKKIELGNEALKLQNKLDANFTVKAIIENKGKIVDEINSQEDLTDEQKDFFTKKVNAIADNFDNSEVGLKKKELNTKIGETQKTLSDLAEKFTNQTLPSDRAETKLEIDTKTKELEDLNNELNDLVKTQKETKVEEELVEPTQEQLFDDIKNKRFTTAEFKSESEIPEVWKEKVTSTITNPDGTTTYRVTLPATQFEYESKTGTSKVITDYPTETKKQQDAIQKQSTDESVLLTEQPQLGLQEVVEGNEKPQETTVTTEGTQETIKVEGIDEYDQNKINERLLYLQEKLNKAKEDNDESDIEYYSEEIESLKSSPLDVLISNAKFDIDWYKTKLEEASKIKNLFKKDRKKDIEYYKSKVKSATEKAERLKALKEQQAKLPKQETVTTQVTQEVDPLKDVESTSNAISKGIYDDVFKDEDVYKIYETIPRDYVDMEDSNNNIVAEAYHKAKADGTNPELVKAVEDLLVKPKETKTEVTPTVTPEVVNVELKPIEVTQQSTVDSEENKTQETVNPEKNNEQETILINNENPISTENAVETSKEGLKHASELGGTSHEIADGIGITQAFNHFGEPIYVAYKKGSRTRVDIDNFNNSNGTFTEAEINALKNLKKELIEKENQNESESNDPFTEQGRVASSDSVPKEVKGFVKALTESLGIDKKIFIITDADFNESQYKKHGLFGKLAQIRSAILGAKNPFEFGSKRYMAKADAYYIYYDGKLKGKELFTVVSHEIGHIVEQESFKNANQETKNKIKDDYNKWLANLEGKTVDEVQKETRDITIQHLLEGNTAKFDANQHKYISSFSEYLADNVAKWVRSSEKPKTLVDKFFANLANTFKRIKNYIYKTENYSKSIFEWLDDLYGKNVTKEVKTVEAKTETKTAEEKPQTATEKRKAAKALLDSLREGNELSSSLAQSKSNNTQAKLDALLDYHKALVEEAKEFIKDNEKGDINDWAESIGEPVDKIIKTAWDEATGKPEITKGEDLDYTFEETFREDIKSHPDYEKTMEDVEYEADEAYKPINYLKEVLKNAKEKYEKYKELNKEDRNPKTEQRLKDRVEKAKAELEEYEKHFEDSKERAIEILKESDLYKNASGPQQELLVRDVLSRFGERQKRAPSAEKILGKKPQEKTVLMTEKEALIKQIKDLSRGGKDATKTIKEVTASIAKTLKDLQTKGELTVDQVNRILGKLGKLNMLKEDSVNKFIDDITEVFEDAQEAKTAKDKKTIIKKMLELVNKKAKTLITASGKRKSKGLDADGQLFFQSIKEIVNAASDNDTTKIDDITNKLANRQSEIDDAVQKEMTGQPLTLEETILLNQVMAVDMFGDMINMSVDEIESLYDSLKDVRAESIKRLKKSRLESAAKKASMVLEANDNIQEGFGILFNADGTPKSEKDLNQDKKDIYESFKKLKIWDGVKKYLARYDFNNKNFITNFFRNKAANIGTIANILDKKGDLFKRNVYDKLNDMNEKKRIGIEAQTKLLDTLANKIFGTKKNGYQKLKYELAGKGTKKININGRDYTFNYGQLLRMYALSLNRVQRGKLEKMGFDSAKMQEIKTALGPEFTKFADDVVEYLSTDYFGTVNDVYRKVNDVNLNQIENYFPTKTVSKEANAELLQKGDFNGIFNAETSPAFKERLDKTSPIDLEPSFTDVLDNHVETMEMYKSHAEDVKEMNTFFSIPSVKTLLDQTGLGPVLKFNVNSSISPNANAPIKAKGMDKIINSFTPFALAFKGMQFVKQATSIGAAYGDYSFRKNKQMFLADLPFFIADVAKIMVTPRANIKKFKNISATFKERYDSGLAGNVASIESGNRTFLSSAQKNTRLGKFKRGFRSAAGFATFAGDIVSTFGYMANYNRDIKNGMNPEKALQKFNDYNATLQTKRPSEKSPIQHNQDFLSRTVTMFGSSGLLMMNTVSQSTKSILRSIGKGESPKTRDIRKLVFAVGVGNALFIAASNAFKLMSGDDEDKEKANKDIFEALIGLNLLTQLPVIGEAVEYLKSKANGERFYDSSSTNPLLQVGKKITKIYDEEQGNIIKALRPIAEMEAGFQFDPFIALGNSVVEGEVNEDDMYDMLGVAKSYRPTGEEEQEARAEKNVKEEDTTSKELESLQELINTEKDADIINEAVKRIEYLRMDDDEKKQYKKERKEEVKAEKDELDALLGEYDSKDEMRRYDKTLYEKTFGEGSDYYNKNEAKSKMEAKVRELEQEAEDKERGFSEPVKEKKSKKNSDGSYKRTYKRTYKSSYKRSYQSGN